MARPLQSQWASSYQLYYTIPQSPILMLRPLYCQGTKMHKWHAMDPTAAPFMLFGGGWCRGQAGSIRFQLGFQVYPVLQLPSIMAKYPLLVFVRVQGSGVWNCWFVWETWECLGLRCVCSSGRRSHRREQEVIQRSGC